MKLEGDRNTTYFLAVANHRFRNKWIECLQGPNGLVDNQSILKIVASVLQKNI
jgi:hypothetical protein